jgi:hypothetical protein
MPDTVTRRRELKNVTLTLDEALLRRARVMAAEDDKSLSAFLADILRERLTSANEYSLARDAFLRQEPILNTGGMALPKRDTLYDRGLLR